MNQTKCECRLNCVDSNLKSICDCYCHQTNNRIREEWIDKFKEKFTMEDWNIYIEHATLVEDQISFIDELLKSQREETMKQIESGLENYFLSSYPIPDSKVIIGYLRESLIKEE